MRCMDSMLSYGDHSAVIGGIYENVHSMEVIARVLFLLLLIVSSAYEL